MYPVNKKAFIVSYLVSLALFTAFTFLYTPYFSAFFQKSEYTYADISVPVSTSVPLIYSDRAPALSAAVSARSAVLIDASSGAVLFEKNSSERLPMASTTKIMTALIILEKMQLDEVVSVPKEATLVEGSSIYLRENEEITVETLLYGLLLESGNDAAHTLAVACSGSIEAFADEMNKKATGLGLQNTCFKNPHGLTAEGHYTTAYELARITAEAMKNPVFCKIVSTQKMLAPSIDGELTRLFLNHNKLLKYYDGAVGVKTGYTEAAGRCLVSAAEKTGFRFIAVTLNDRDDWDDHCNMLNFAFENFKTIEIAAQNEFGVYIDGLRYSNPEGIYLTVPVQVDPVLSYQCSFDSEKYCVRYYVDGIDAGVFYLSPPKQLHEITEPAASLPNFRPKQ